MRDFVLKLVALTLVVGCTRRPLSDVGCNITPEGTQIAVAIDWSLSGLDPVADSGQEGYIHRVTFRFFPLDGSEPFDRYLEGNVARGYIYVPIGEYSVVVFNESIYDNYWREAIAFENTNDYDRFAARLVDEDESNFDFYDRANEEALSVEALRLASWSLDYFAVSEQMAKSSTKGYLSPRDRAMALSLTNITPRRLCCSTTVAAKVENLKSAYFVRASLSGLAQRVYMASGDTDSASTTHLMELNKREWDEGSTQHGTISVERLTMSTPSEEQPCEVTLDILLIDGSHHQSDEELRFDVTDQIMGREATTTRYADDDLSAEVQLSLPDVNGDIAIEAWGDENEITIL